MEQLKRVSWKVGQPLLPRHLVAQEDSLVAHTNSYFKQVGLPLYGVGCLKWDDTLLSQGIVSITKLTVIFPSGKLVDVPGNSTINSIDLNKVGESKISCYLNLLADLGEEEDYFESGIEQEKIVYALHHLELSAGDDVHAVKATLKLADFEQDLENNRWKLVETYIPPLLSVHSTPFLRKPLMELKTRLEQFQRSLEVESTTGESFEGHTLETKFCLLEIAKMRRLLLNIDLKVADHPFFFYQALSQYIDLTSLLYSNRLNFKLIPYQHEKLGPLFVTLMEALSLEEIGEEEVSRLAFEKKEKCYVSEKIPQEIQDAKETYLILQKVDMTGNPNIEGVKLSAYSRLMNTVIFGVEGIPLVRVERAPFNHSFSKRANIYSVDKGIEWGYAIKEGRFAFDCKDSSNDIQAFLYWR